MKTVKILAAICFAIVTTGRGDAQNLRITGSTLINFSVLDNHSSYVSIEKEYLPDSACFVSGIPHPNRFITQEYGFLPIKRHTIEEIESDFMGLGITEKERTGSHVRIVSNQGWDITFDISQEDGYDNNAMSAEFNAENFFEVQQMALAWRKDLAKRGLTKSYLIDNPYYSDELYIASRINPATSTEYIETDPWGLQYKKAKNAIMLVPDLGSYGKQFNDSLISWIKVIRPEWFATTIFNLEIQEEIDRAMSSGQDDASLIKTISKHFSFSKKEDIRNTNAFKLIKTLANLGIRMICLGHEDGTKCRTNLTSYGDAIRNMHWAAKIPQTGRGMLLVMPSSACINHPYNIQDFIKAKVPSFSLFSLTEFVYFKASDLNARNLSPIYSEMEDAVEDNDEPMLMPHQIANTKELGQN